MERFFNIVGNILCAIAATTIIAATCQVFGFSDKETAVIVLALLIGYVVFWD